MGFTAAASGFVIFIFSILGGRFVTSSQVYRPLSDLQVQVNSSSGCLFSSCTWAELKCVSDRYLPQNLPYVWYKNGEKIPEETTSSYSGYFYPADSYSCAVKGHEHHPSPSVYTPVVPSVWVSPSGEIMAGSSVTLTCGSDANPAAKYTWYKKNVNQYRTFLSNGPQLVLRYIQPSGSGEYYCTAENELGRRTSNYIFINVKYAPKLPSVSVSPSGEIVEGSSVNLTCSSDANPAANYTWYKENEDSPKASGQIFTITDFRSELSGNYYCEAENRRGRHNSTLHLIVVAVSPLGNSTMIMNIIRVTLVVLMLIPLLLLTLWTRRKKTALSSTTEPNEENIELDSSSVYENFSDLKAVTAAQTEDTEEQEDMV